MNKRLLEFTCNGFDYTKVKNTSYVKRNKNKLLLNYFWHKTNDITKIVLKSKKLCKGNWLKNLISLGLSDIILNKYNTLNCDEIINIINDKRCVNCNKLISNNNEFCSNKCSNTYKSKNVDFIKKLSTSISNYHKNMSNLKKTELYEKISHSINKTNDNLSIKEKSEKYSNNVLNYTAFDNLGNRFTNLEFLFDSDYFYKNKSLPVKCKTCGFIWEMTKSTSIVKTECVKCIPKIKHKTQTKIFNYIYENVFAKENDKSVISNELDIYVPSLNFAIEYDGLLNHSYGPSKISYYNKYNIDQNYHLRKTEECEKLNIQLFHIFENEYLDKTKRKIWLSKLNNKIKKSQKIYARHCTIKEISYTTSKEFLTKTHLQGNCKSIIRLGLYFNENLMSVMTFRKHIKHDYEIARFSSELNTTVVGGASKLLKYFETRYKPSSIISYANRRWSQGNLYEKLGFTFSGNTPPNYFYFKVNDNVLYSREKFQKHKLEKLLPLFDSSLTETENMFNNGYRKIYDCGNKRYIKNY